MAKQLVMDLKRARVRLEEDEEEVRVRLPKRAAAAVAAADPKEVELALQVKAGEMLDSICTPWYCWEAPPQPGIYELTDHKTGTQRHRWWFAGSTWRKSADPDANEPAIFHHDLAHTYAWRGLRAAPISGYSVPPYARRMFENRADGLMPKLTVAAVLLSSQGSPRGKRLRLED